MTNKSSRYKPITKDIQDIVNKIGNDPEDLLDVLTKIQTLPDSLSNSNISSTARAMGIPDHHVYGVKSFYSMLATEPRKNIVRVCDGPVCWLRRSSDGEIEDDSDIVELINHNIEKDWIVERSSCLGLCDQAPALLINDDQTGPVRIHETNEVCRGWEGVPVDYSSPRHGEVRVMLENIGEINPDDIQSALNFNAYKGLSKSLKQSPSEVIDMIELSGLQGRGGAGFPVGRKWRFVQQASSSIKYIIANADESEPLIFKDRVLMDTNPHQLLEGMAIGGFACGASQGYIYIRGEYQKQYERLIKAISQAESLGWLGEDIQGSGFSFHIHVHKGAGAYICGEETALIESMEGKRGEPRLRPPYPPTFGFRGHPTAVNNIESFSAVPKIILNGPKWWKDLGNFSTPGTKLYMVLGHVNNPGLFEAPFGITLRQIINDFGGGLLEGSEFKFALTGGAAGTFVDSSKLDIPLDFSSWQNGISLGAGAFLICDQRVSALSLLRELLHFFSVESCGKCTPCRVGTWRAYELLKNMASGSISREYTEELRAISKNLQLASFCGLGQSVAIPIDSALASFPIEFAPQGK